MLSKAETQTHLKAFVTLVERQFETKVKVIRSDNGAAFIMHQFFESTGIVHQTSRVETPQQNGIIERKHQHLLNVTRALLFQSKLPPMLLHTSSIAFLPLYLAIYHHTKNCIKYHMTLLYLQLNYIK